MFLLTAEQLAAFEEDGAVLVDPQLSSSFLDRMESAWDRIKAESQRMQTSGTLQPGNPMSAVGYTAPVYDGEYLEFIALPIWEQIAKQVLRSPSVYIFESGPHERAPSGAGPHPNWQEEWERSMHLDVQLTTADFNATPRREMLAIWVWLTDVPAHRGAMRVLKGSHRVIMAHWDRQLASSRQASLPRVHGLRPPAARQATETADVWRSKEIIPELTSTPFCEQEPSAMVARRGQAQCVRRWLLWHPRCWPSHAALAAGCRVDCPP